MRNWMLAVVGLGVLCLPAPLEAQRPITLSVGGGVSVPLGDFADGVNPGWHALGSIGLSSLMQPLGLRLDAAHNQFGFDDEAAAGDGTVRVTSGTLNVSYRLPLTDSPFSPYLISGLGGYHSDCSLDGAGCEGTTKFGWNIGAGTKLYVLGFRSFIEARYHRTERGDSDVHYVPVTFAVTF